MEGLAYDPNPSHKQEDCPPSAEIPEYPPQGTAVISKRVLEYPLWGTPSILVKGLLRG
ncbi:MAG: hypothetical protein PUF62_02850 [Bacteroidales bacterium]|nr:hypothetical protein [Bacteroidales bacterium]